MIRIEFFHDTICSFCFPMSARLRKIAEKYDNLDIQHKSFALAWTDEDYIREFSSREAVKDEIVKHWHMANANDDEHRFNIEGMKKVDFNFPTSKNGLLAAKAAGILGGESLYWDAFDSIQHKFFVENKNIEDFEVLKEAMQDIGLDVDKWTKAYKDPKTEEAVLDDLKLARYRGISLVPTLVIDDRKFFIGAESQEEIEKVLNEILDKKH